MYLKNVLLLLLGLLLFTDMGISGDVSSPVGSSSSPNDSGQKIRGYPCENDLIEVIFQQDSRVRLRDDKLVDLQSNALEGLDLMLKDVASYSWERICNLPESRLDKIYDNGQNKSGRRLYNMNNIYRLRFSGKQDIWDLCDRLEQLPGIMTARPVPLPPPLPVGIYEPQQYYLDSAGSTPTGIDAEYSWTVPGGTGAGITICDIEYGWNYSHADLTKSQNSQINPETIALPPGETDDHGTAVIGEMISDNNGWGTTGICYDATLKTCGAYYGSPLSFNPAGAIAYAIDSLSAGDIILIELQWDYNDTSTAYTDFIPIEWYTDTFPNAQTYNAVYIAIENAIANGIHVVEAGGNGGAPTPNSGYNTGNLTWYGNSGAIIVGAGGAYSGGTYPQGDLERIYWSSYGPRYDLQGGGENVVTTGYGDLYNAGGKDSLYTNIFAGTSSASPMVAGAIACCMGYAQNQGWIIDSLTPSKIRDVLWATGTPQDLGGPTGNIGPRPNLKKAFDSLSSFTDATFSALRNNSRSTRGIAWGDYDNDNDLDIYLSNYYMPNNLYQNDGSGNFTDVAGSPINDADPGTGVAWGDYDNDGYLDLYNVKFSILGAIHANSLFHNEGDGTFTDATPAVLADTGWSAGMGWADYDLDGDIDIFFTSETYYGQGSKLMRNDGGGNFTDVTSTAVPPSSNDDEDIAWGDYNNDGYDDIYITSLGASLRNYLFRNNGDGTFTDMPAAPVTLYTSSYCASWGDYNNDGYLDLFVGGYNYGNYLFRNNGDGTFTDVSSSPLSDVGPTVDVAWGDYDNDMDLDIYLVNDRKLNKLLRNDGGGVFTDITVPALAIIDSLLSNSAAWGDYDADGDIDLLASAHEQYGEYLFRNRVGANNNWLYVNLVGTNANYYGIGARIRVVAGGISQIREVDGGSNRYSQNSLKAEFGLGSNTMADTVEITWPTTAKTVTIRTNVSANQTMTVHEVTNFICGDINGDLTINIFDITALISYLYLGGVPPVSMNEADVNSDSAVNIFDITYLITYLYLGGPAPNCP